MALSNPLAILLNPLVTREIPVEILSSLPPVFSTTFNIDCSYLLSFTVEEIFLYSSLYCFIARPFSVSVAFLSFKTASLLMIDCFSDSCAFAILSS